MLFAAEGAAICIADIADAEGVALAERIMQTGGRAKYVHLDVADIDCWKAAIDVVKADFGALHILINNAGTISRKGIKTIGLDDWHRVLDVNVTGPLLGMQLCAPLIRDSGGGSIVNVSSTAGMTAHYDAAYGASKWALRGLSKSAAMEYVDWNIRVNSMHPGQISDTTFSRNAVPGHWGANWLVTPMGRHGTAEECARVALFLASPDSSFITGEEITIDGGMLGAGLMRLRAQLTREIAAGERPEGTPQPIREHP
jgi:3alpha(or 20beta)-hydroxysteroid dehydrogenase